MEDNVRKLAKKIWDYHHMNQRIEKADCMLVLGNPDKRTAECAAKLFLEGWAPIMLIAGNRGHFTENWDRPEAEVFADIVIQLGVPRAKILMENKSTNTGENIIFAKALSKRNNLEIRKVIIVCNPLMERRSYATFKKVWPETEVIATSPNISFEECPIDGITENEVIHLLVGWLQRIKVWAERGYQIPQEVPSNVSEAYEELVKLGYTKYLVAE